MLTISKTPLRVSFFSGGSDIPAFYNKAGIGAALSVTIDKYIYVYLHERQYPGIRTVFDSIEDYNELNLMQAGIARECLSSLQKDNNITIGSLSDINARGSGLGSSSAFTVGLLNVLNSSSFKTYSHLAEAAFNVEANMCGYPVGKQDQYAAAYGGFNLYEFHNAGIVKVVSSEKGYKIEDKLLLVYSGKGREANKILQKHNEAVLDADKYKLIENGRENAYKAFNLLETEQFDEFGKLLNIAWEEKKKIVDTISNDYFDDIYNKAMSAGALGGKLLGAGGGGFFVFYVPEYKRQSVIDSIKYKTECTIFDFQFKYNGSRIIKVDY
jgi:D-glycero-alpha-D-manno-heptose-7-phosphate kinase